MYFNICRNSTKIYCPEMNIDQRSAYFTQGKPPRTHLSRMGIAKWRKTKTFNKAFTCRAVFCRHISDGSTLTRWSGSRDPSHNRFSKYFHNHRIPPPFLTHWNISYVSSKSVKLNHSPWCAHMTLTKPSQTNAFHIPSWNFQVDFCLSAPVGVKRKGWTHTLMLWLCDVGWANSIKQCRLWYMLIVNHQ